MSKPSSNENENENVWFITGASSGFGRAIAEDAIARGHRVVVTARRTGILQELAASAPDRVLVLELDVTQAAQGKDAVAKALARFGRIDVLVNNAGFSIVGALEETPEQDLRDAMELMFFGAVHLTREVLPAMRAQASGVVVQVTSVGGLTTAPGFGAYCAAKHALEGLSECLAAEVATFGIRVLVVEPGAFRTALFGGAFRTMPATETYAASVGPTRAYVESSAGKQPGDPVKAARAIVDAASAAAASSPLRLPLGADAVDGIRAKLAQVASDVDRTEAVARATAL